MSKFGDCIILLTDLAERSSLDGFSGACDMMENLYDCTTCSEVLKSVIKRLEKLNIEGHILGHVQKQLDYYNSLLNTK